MSSNITSLLDELEAQREQWVFTDDDITEFNKTGWLTISSSVGSDTYSNLWVEWDWYRDNQEIIEKQYDYIAQADKNWTLNSTVEEARTKLDDYYKSKSSVESSASSNVHYDELNKTWENYEEVAQDAAKKLADIAEAEAIRKTEITSASNDVKIARSDETRAEYLETTGDFKDKQDDRYDEVSDITQRQEDIANRQANIAAASAWRYWDIYSDWAMANIKNDIIAKYWENILNAEQYELNTKRTIDNDLLNVWLKELDDKDARDEFKNILLDEENSYMLNAISEAADWNAKAVTDVETFYQTYLKTKADFESQRAGITELRYWLEEEYESSDVFMQANMLRDLTQDVPWFSLVADAIPDLINKYPDLGLSELEVKIAKMAELALTGKQQLEAISMKDEADRTADEKAIYENYLVRWLEEQQRADRSTSETINQNNASTLWNTTDDTPIYDNTPEWQAIIEQSNADKEAANNTTPVVNTTPPTSYTDNQVWETDAERDARLQKIADPKARIEAEEKAAAAARADALDDRIAAEEKAAADKLAEDKAARDNQTTYQTELDRYIATLKALDRDWKLTKSYSESVALITASLKDKYNI